MTHPKYKIVAVSINNGKRAEEVVSKFLLYKDEASRFSTYMNTQNGVYNDEDNQHFYIVVEKDYKVINDKEIKK